jgi:asparagine synthase (glutamine-hydrolysing)
MRARSTGIVRSFTIAFEDLAYDESANAAAVARHLATDHTEFRLTAKDALDVIPKLPGLYDDPFADASQIPTYLVSRLAREHVTVSLSGDGGDELFGGYNRHAWGGPIWRTASRFPMPLRRGVAALLAAPSPARWDAFFERWGALLPRRARVRIPGLKMQKLASVLPARSSEDLYRILASTWQDPSRLVRGVGVVDDLGFDQAIPPEIEDFGSQMMFLDLVTYLPDDILVKLDRASMGVSLESRVPILDHRVVEFAWQTPVALKIRNRTGKWILREVLRRYVPDDLVDRPKAGFGLPLGTWLRGPLRSWAEGLLASDRIRAEGYLDDQLVNGCWLQHLSGERDLEHKLWAVLMFQAWLEAYPS